MLSKMNKINIKRVALWSVGAGLHLLGVSVVWVASLWLLLPAESHAALVDAYHQGAFGPRPHEWLIHLGLSACFWALLVIAWKLCFSPAADRAPRLIRARGAVMLETIIVFPVFLLLTLGLVQLTLLNTSGLLSTLAAFKAGRTVAIWYPEYLEGRNGVDLDLVEEKARLAAASSLAPVAPSDYVINIGDCPASESLDAKLETLADLGHEEMNAESFDDATKDKLSVATAFDQSNFTSRGQAKLIFAHCATTVDYLVNGHEIHTRIQYQQQIAMPVVAYIFGDIDVVGGREGYYTTMERDHITTHQIQSRARAPGG